MVFIVGLILTSIILLASSLQRTYRSVPIWELRRRANAGDYDAGLLYKTAAYGTSLRALLWVFIAIPLAYFAAYSAQALTLGWAIILIVGLIWISFIWLPGQEASRFGHWMALRLSPVITWILQYLHPIIDRLAGFIHHFRPGRFHTGLYDAEDYVQLLEQQQQQPDSRITKGELEIARHALTFGDKSVADILTPRRVVMTVAIDDTTGPILMSELYDSGFSRFPVVDGETDSIVGILYLRDLVNVKTGGKVSKLMHTPVCFVHQDQNLYDALQAILKTHQHLFVVVNSFEEYVGILTMEDVLEQIVGKQIIDEFDQYEDMRTVAKKFAKVDHEAREEEPETSVE